MNIDLLIENTIRRTINEFYKRPINGVVELGPTAVSKKRRYAKQIWDMIKEAYVYIGGCKSFDSIDGDDGFNDFLNGDYIWRVYFGEKPKDIMGVTIYKHTKYGRKRICSCAKNRDIYNVLINHDMFKANHVYAEVSGKSEHVLSKDKRTNWVDKEKVPKFLRKDVDLEQDKDVDSMERIPYDSKRHYYRNLGGIKHRKAMFGNPIDI